MPNDAFDQRFLSTTRGQIVALLWRVPRTVQELATALGLTNNAIRPHLSTLERDGLVRQSGVRHSGRKPAYVYDVTPAAERLFPKAYASVLGHLLDVLGDQLTVDALEAAFREVGSRLAAESGGVSNGAPRDGVARATAVLEHLGGIIEVENSDTQKGAIRLRGYSCPLAAVVPSHPEVCRMIETLLQHVAGVPVKERCDRKGRPRCCFELPVRRRRAA
jgi:predicted ArsR family transcriptional regulator